MPVINPTKIIKNALSSDDLPNLNVSLLQAKTPPCAIQIDHKQTLASEFAEISSQYQKMPIWQHLQMIVINFNNLNDGRGFSLAHLIRRDYNFKGEIRAKGHLIPDQCAYLMQCGFSTIEISEAQFERHPLPQWQNAFNAIALTYPKNKATSRQPIKHVV
ncbi:MAG: DUF934 domain-containing protein [Pseudomonadota bacterium]